MGRSKLKLLLTSVMVCLVFHKTYAGESETELNRQDKNEVATDFVMESPQDQESETELNRQDKNEFATDFVMESPQDQASSSKNDIESDINAPLIVVSNRLPFVLTRNPKNRAELKRTTSAGGLVTAVAPVVVKCKGTWIGWTGLFDLEPTEQIPEPDSNDNTPTAGLKSSQIIPVYLEKHEFDEYYNGFCNTTLWPLFHSMPDRVNFNNKQWEFYYNVNVNFAMRTLEALRNIIKALDEAGKIHTVPIVWIHDYQLLSAATVIRMVAEEEKLRCKLGFFLHIPFPSWDIMRILPWANQILHGMLAYDFVAFHIKDYCINFIDSCFRKLGCRVDQTNMLVELAGRTIQVKALPIGVPYDYFMNLAENAPKYLNMDDKIKYILGIDRLDYTKGIINRLLSFERFLEKYPEFQRKVIFYQISVPSRTDVEQYMKLKTETEHLIGRINGRFSQVDWSPIRYIYNYMKQEELAILYRDGAVALVTPLRDGMNLVSKEFVACQINKRGVLVLSSLAGASVTMTEALLVNPYDMEEMADVLYRALEMTEDERKLRMTKLRNREKKFDVNYWMTSCFSWMGALDVYERSMELKLDDFDTYFEDYFTGANKLCLILDYDHIIANNDPNTISNDIIQILKRLSNVPNINIALQSGKPVDELKEMVNIEKITYSGNHGAKIYQPDDSHFHSPKPLNYGHKIEQLKYMLKEVCVDGAWVELNNVALTYHYKNVPQNKQEILKNRAIEIIKNSNFDLHSFDFSIQAILQSSWNPGHAAMYIIRHTYGLEWLSDGIRIVYAGSEEAMATLKGIARTFLVDSSQIVENTAADYRLSGPLAVYTMLHWIEEYTRNQTPPVQMVLSHNRLQYLNKGSFNSVISSDDDEINVKKGIFT